MKKNSGQKSRATVPLKAVQTGTYKAKVGAFFKVRAGAGAETNSLGAETKFRLLNTLRNKGLSLSLGVFCGEGGGGLTCSVKCDAAYVGTGS